MRQLNDILLGEALVTDAQLATATIEQKRMGRPLGRVLIDTGVLTEAQLVSALATQIGLRFVDLSEFPVDGSAVSLVSAAVSRRHNAIAIGYEDGKLLVAMADPANVFPSSLKRELDQSAACTGNSVTIVVSGPGNDFTYQGGNSVAKLCGVHLRPGRDTDRAGRGQYDRNRLRERHRTGRQPRLLYGRLLRQQPTRGYPGRHGDELA